LCGSFPQKRVRGEEARSFSTLKRNAARENVERLRAALLRTRRSAWLWLAAPGRFFLILAVMVAMESNSKMFEAR
jgi:hypothetical protein